MSRTIAESRAIYRKLLITGRLLNGQQAVGYSAEVPNTRWGEAINRLLAERGWTQRQLAAAASIRPNTVTNIIKHGRESDTATLTRIATALNVDIAELFLTREQSVILHAHRESQVDRLKEMVVRELSETVTRIVTQELEGAGYFSEAAKEAAKDDRYLTQRSRKKRAKK
jgi:transcriptional regulator with XRE-family HTH domain